MGRKQTKEKPKLKERLSFKDSMQDLFCEKSNIEICDNTRAIIEGSKGVVEYSDTVIRISLGTYTVAFVGRGMNLKCLSPTSLIIEGFFLNVEFCV